MLDLSRVPAGPWCTQNLADMGADVIKIEKPGAGDDTRHWGPPFFADAAGAPTDNACYFAACNRNKRSVTVDMASPEGQDLIRELPSQSDVLVSMVGAASHREPESWQALQPAAAQADPQP